jgi:hypothetical protein
MRNAFHVLELTSGLLPRRRYLSGHTIKWLIEGKRHENADHRAVAVASLAGRCPRRRRLGPCQYLEAARCRGLAASENLGKLDTAAIDAFLREPRACRATSP